MQHPRIAFGAALLLASLSSAAQAQNISGVELEVSHLSSNADRFGFTSYGGGVEAQVVNNFYAGGNLALIGFGRADTDGSVLTLRGGIDNSYGIKGGLFLAFESNDNIDNTVWGFEGNANFSNAQGEAYLGFTERGNEDLTLFGVGGSYILTESIAVTASYNMGKGDGEKSHRFAFGGEYGVIGGPVLFGEIGHVNSQVNANYLNIGARVALGANAGTTFSNRGILDALRSY